MAIWRAHYLDDSIAANKEQQVFLALFHRTIFPPNSGEEHKRTMQNVWTMDTIMVPTMAQDNIITRQWLSILWYFHCLSWFSRMQRTIVAFMIIFVWIHGLLFKQNKRCAPYGKRSWQKRQRLMYERTECSGMVCICWVWKWNSNDATTENERTKTFKQIWFSWLSSNSNKRYMTKLMRKLIEGVVNASYTLSSLRRERVWASLRIPSSFSISKKGEADNEGSERFQLNRQNMLGMEAKCLTKQAKQKKAESIKNAP